MSRFLKVGKHNIDTNKIVDVISPSAHASQEGPSVQVWYDSGRDDVFQGEEAAIVRDWLAKQSEKPDTLPITTKVETRGIAKK